MGDAGFFKGTSADQDARFSNKHRKLLKSMTFPASFKKKVDITKVNVDLMQPWIAQRIKDLLGIDDEVVTEFVFGMLAEKDLDPRKIQIDLTGFLEDKTPQFVTELWDMLLSAQENVGGIPTQLIEQKKKEIMEKRKAEEEINRRIDEMRKKERVEEGEQESRTSSYKPAQRSQVEPNRARVSRFDRQNGDEDTRRTTENERRDVRPRERNRSHSRERYNRRDREHNHSHNRRRRSRSREDRSSRYQSHRDRHATSRRDDATHYDRDTRHRHEHRDRQQDRDRDRDRHYRRHEHQQQHRERSHRRSSPKPHESGGESDRSDGLEQSRRQRRHRRDPRDEQNSPPRSSSNIEGTAMEE